LREWSEKEFQPAAVTNFDCAKLRNVFMVRECRGENNSLQISLFTPDFPQVFTGINGFLQGSPIFILDNLGSLPETQNRGTR
jgi:hypothetical protein